VHRRLAAVALIAAVTTISACSGAPATPASTEAPAPAASAAPSPTLPADVAKLLAARLGAMTSSEERLSGSLQVGDVRATFVGSESVNGPDSKSDLSTTVAGAVTTESHVKAAGTRYVKRGEGPWLLDTGAAASADFGSTLRDALDSATDIDASSTASTHHLQSTVQSFDPIQFGFARIGQASRGSATYTFVARPDGAPVSVRIEASWKQAAGANTVDAVLDMTIDFVSLDSHPTIARPDAVWSIYQSAEDHYTIAYPPGYDRTRQSGIDYFFGPDSAHFAWVQRQRLPSGATLNLLAGQELRSLKKLVGAKSGTNDGASADGADARLLSVTGTSKQFGAKVLVYEALVVKGKLLFSIGYFAPAGNEAVDRGILNALLATFRTL